MQKRRCPSIETAKQVQQMISQACGDSTVELCTVEVAGVPTKSVVVIYTDDVPSHALDQPFNVRDLLRHLRESHQWSSAVDAAARLGQSLRSLDGLISHCIDEGWVECGANKNALRITVAGRRALERSSR